MMPASADGGVTNVIVATNDGSIRVLGDIEWTDAGSSDSLTLNAGRAITELILRVQALVFRRH